MSKATALLSTTIALIVGCIIGNRIAVIGAHSAAAHVAPPAATVERYRIPVESAPIKGGERAKVTIVEFSDFECPFCSRLEPTLADLMRKYGRDVRLAWKDFPLSQHRDAFNAAVAGRAAAAQGKFWPMHDKMFANQRAAGGGLGRDDLIKTAQSLGVDIGKSLDDAALQSEVRRDLDDARRFAVAGTPSLFINGRPYKGPLTVDALSPLIDEEIANADRALAAGADAKNLYAALTKDARPAAANAQPQKAPALEIAAGNAPLRGKSSAKVTIVEFSDFQCPACGRAEPTVQALQKQLGDGVKLVWKNFPLESMHPFARQAAEAALAAGAQGKFWEMHDLLFANQQALDRASIDGYAKLLGLDVKKLDKALDTHSFAAAVDADLAQGKQLGISGTPTFFVDGQRIGNWTTELLATAQQNLKRAQVAARPRPGRPDPSAVYRALVGDAPSTGAKSPKVTLVEWGDFQCPYAGRLAEPLRAVSKKHPNDLRVVYKQFPLPNHSHAHLAAEASLAANAQGMFWPMNEAMFAHQDKLDRDGLTALAASVGIALPRFNRELDAGTWKKRVDEEVAEGQKIGVQGTPTYFLDGKFHEGAVPADQLDALVVEAINAADARIKAGTPRARLYDALMKTALTEVKAPPLVDPEKRSVDPGPSAPSRGRASAPVTIVEWSDFQCPFCKRAASLVDDVVKQHDGQVRVVFRNFPLPYHKGAHLAAVAALAAKQQGRFWEMHDKLFANQATIADGDRAALEGLARDVGLDMGKFDAALDDKSLADAVQRDMLAGGGLVDGTPTVFVNGHKLTNPALLAQVVDAELHRK